MPGSATIGTNLVDSLLGTVDDLRDSLNTAMGTRQWRVYLVTRTWADGVVGQGTYTDAEVELTPQPLVAPDDRVYSATPAGLEEDGGVTLSEVSLTYTEDQLRPAGVAGVEHLYALKEAHGQSLATRYFVLAEPPKADRVQSIGWVIRLRAVNVDGCA